MAESFKAKIRALKLPVFVETFFLRETILRGLALDPTFNKVMTIGRLRQTAEITLEEATSFVETLYKGLGFTKEGEPFLTDSERAQVALW